MKLYNTLTRAVKNVKPLDGKTVRVYSCGPTVYDHAHIGNLSAYIFADTLRRALRMSGFEVQHVMNYTDVDDKTIRRSREQYPDDEPREALRKLTGHYIDTFLDDMQKIGNDVGALDFLRATDTIGDMQQLIVELLNGNFAYTTDDGIYFSIEAYKNAGHTYGQLSPIDANNTSSARIANDEYDKESVHDFALWKKQKDGEPAWDFALPDGQHMPGRPGWHIECSAMSRKALGQPFDIHTGGVDLIFPHHENEIAQSTALEQATGARMAQFFCHNEHILVDGRKMAKSEGNFFTLEDILAKGYDPLAFRLLVLQSHYRSQTNFSWENLDAAQNRLKAWQAFADLKWQPKGNDASTAREHIDWHKPQTFTKAQLSDDLNTPQAITWLDRLSDEDELLVLPDSATTRNRFQVLLEFFDKVFGLSLSNRSDIGEDAKHLIADREKARKAKDWTKADAIRDQLAKQGIGLRDTEYGPIWYRTKSA